MTDIREWIKRAEITAEDARIKVWSQAIDEAFQAGVARGRLEAALDPKFCSVVKGRHVK